MAIAILEKRLCWKNEKIIEREFVKGISSISSERWFQISNENDWVVWKRFQ